MIEYIKVEFPTNNNDNITYHFILSPNSKYSIKELNCQFAHKNQLNIHFFIDKKHHFRYTRYSLYKSAKKLKKVVDICLAFCYYIRAPRTEAKR